MDSKPITPAAVRGRVLREGYITRASVRARPDTTFVFGDNMARSGLGGQAGQMRGEPNAIGIPTKWRPARDPGAYFTDADAWDEAVKDRIIQGFVEIEAALISGRDVVIPEDGLGTGLAELPKRAPKLHGLIQSFVDIVAAGPVITPESIAELGIVELGIVRGEAAAVPAQLCPCCGYASNNAFNLGQIERNPKPGDWMLCAGCGETLVVADGLRLAIPQPGEWEAFAAENPVGASVMTAAAGLIRKARRNRGATQQGGTA